MWKITGASISVLFCLYFFGCSLGSDQNSLTSYLSSSGELPQDARIRRVQSNSRNIQDNSEECSKSRTCRSVCDDIYLKARELDRCYSSTANEVKRAAEVFEVLFAPRNLSELTDIHYKDFGVFLDIGYHGFLDLIDPTHKDEDGDRRNNDWEDRYAYDSRSALLILEWIAIDEDIAKTVSSEDKEGEIARHLFCVHGQSITEEDGFSLDVDIQSGHQVLFDGDKSDCHDEKTPSVLYGFADDAFDDVSFITFSKENDNAQEFGERLVSRFCSSAHCEAVFYCLSLKKQGLEGDTLRGFNRSSCASYIKF